MEDDEPEARLNMHNIRCNWFASHTFVTGLASVLAACLHGVKGAHAACMDIMSLISWILLLQCMR